MDRYLITGASRGIGRAIAEKLAAPDRTLLLHGRDPEALEESSRLVESKGGKATRLTADLSRVDGIESLIEAVGGEPLHVLINNAGVAFARPIRDLNLDSWLMTLMVNIAAPVLLSQRLLPLMSRGASIVNILSMAAKAGIPQWSSYCMSKFAVEGFSQSLREELRPEGIRVINIYPSATNTDMWNAVPGEWSRDKMLRADEVAEAVAFALSRPPEVLVDTVNVGDVTGKL
jgi:NAD(P)-dependent dehydrogenase (short-subunit alcohol dehydrogenase family)